MNKRFLMMVVIFFGLSILVGCDNTVKGFGQDMENMGQKVKSSAEK